MLFRDYQTIAYKALNPLGNELSRKIQKPIAVLGLLNELGQISDIAAKQMYGKAFDGWGDDLIKACMQNMLWYLWLLSYSIDSSLEEIAEAGVYYLSNTPFPNGFPNDTTHPGG